MFAPINESEQLGSHDVASGPDVETDQPLVNEQCRPEPDDPWYRRSVTTPPEFLSDLLRKMVDMSTPQPCPTEPPDDPFSVEAIMARLVAGDAAAVFTLVERHGHRVAGVIRRQLHRCGVDHITPDDLQALVIDACFEVRDVAPAWRPGGALPWWWAEGRIRAVVNGWVGVHADAIDDHWSQLDGEGEAPAPSVDASIAETFARLVEEVPLVGLVAEAARAARIDHTALVCLLDYRIQQDQGDPSPAHTLAHRYGVTPEALRQRVSRGRRRLRHVVETDPRFAALADFELVA